MVVVGICVVGAPDEKEKGILAGDGNWKYVEVDPSIEADLVVVVVVDEVELNYFEGRINSINKSKFLAQFVDSY